MHANFFNFYKIEEIRKQLNIVILFLAVHVSLFIKEIKNNSKLFIFPNPATDKINISFPVSSSQHITTKIFSVTGEVVFKEENKTGANYFSETIDVKDFSNGIYFLSVKMEKEMITRKIVVQH